MAEEKEHSDEWKAGFVSFNEGDEPLNNPFDPASIEWYEWYAGYFRAYDLWEHGNG